MQTFDRIVLTVLVLGIWVLVLTPQDLGAHHEDARHRCTADGTGYGEIDGTDVWIYLLDIDVRCKHR